MQDTDLKILDMLQENARISNAEIARQIGLAPSAIYERIKKLEERGVIRGYRVDIDPSALGLDLTAFILVRTDEGHFRDDIGSQIATFPEVQEVHNVAGEDCYIVKVRAHDTKSLAGLLQKRFRQIEGKVTTKTIIVLNTLKESCDLALYQPKDA